MGHLHFFSGIITTVLFVIYVFILTSCVSLSLSLSLFFLSFDSLSLSILSLHSFSFSFILSLSLSLLSLSFFLILSISFVHTRFVSHHLQKRVMLSRAPWPDSGQPASPNAAPNPFSFHMVTTNASASCCTETNSGVHCMSYDISSTVCSSSPSLTNATGLVIPQSDQSVQRNPSAFSNTPANGTVQSYTPPAAQSFPSSHPMEVDGAPDMDLYPSSWRKAVNS